MFNKIFRQFLLLLAMRADGSLFVMIIESKYFTGTTLGTIQLASNQTLCVITV